MSTSPHLGKRVLLHTFLPPIEGTITAYHGNGWYSVETEDGTRKYSINEWMEL